MADVRVGDVRIEYETFGASTDPTMLLIMGLGMQLTGWDAAFCKKLASHGFHVIRFDNRDIGLSSRHIVDVEPDLFAIFAGDHTTVPYSLDDLAADAVGLLDALHIDKAHVVGASMGGMIAQLIAIQYPERVLSLASIMATTGSRSVGQPTPAAIAALMAPSSGSAEEDAVRIWRAIGSTTYALSDRQIHALARADMQRSTQPGGGRRQLAAILAAPDRTLLLCELDVPTVVIHGREDPLVDVSGGEATAMAIPNAKLVVIDGMAHDMPQPCWDQIIGAIVSNAGSFSSV